MKQNRAAFTLVELVVVIAIIITLAALLLPTTGSILGNAHKSKDASNLRQICLAYAQYAHGTGKVRSMAPSKVKNVYQWAAQLAHYAQFNDASVYYIDNDPALLKSSKAVSVLEDPQDITSMSSTFMESPVGYAVAVGIPADGPASKIPVAWTRGLQEDGRWSKDSPYQGTGGYIGFLDGHVAWYTHLQSSEEAALVELGTGNPTTNIKKAIGATTNMRGAVILEYSASRSS